MNDNIYLKIGKMEGEITGILSALLMLKNDNSTQHKELFDMARDIKITQAKLETTVGFTEERIFVGINEITQEIKKIKEAKSNLLLSFFGTTTGKTIIILSLILVIGLVFGEKLALKLINIF